jgi:hypothetical protein
LDPDPTLAQNSGFDRILIDKPVSNTGKGQREHKRETPKTLGLKEVQ